MTRVSKAMLTFGAIAVSLIANTAAAQERDIKDEVEQSQKAARVFQEIMSAPDKAIPADVLSNAKCVAVFPEVVKAAFGVGGRGGRGVASCRTPQGWSAPAYFGLGGGSFGFQIGVEVTDFIMLFMGDDGMNSLLSSKVELGGDASVAAGPVGREAGAATDAKFNSQILSVLEVEGALCGRGTEGHRHRNPRRRHEGRLRSGDYGQGCPEGQQAYGGCGHPGVS